MVNAKKDGNRISTMTGVLNTNGSTIVNIQADPASNNSMMVDDNTTGSDNGPTPGRSLRDENYVTTLYAVSESDGETPVALYVTNSGELLIDHT